MDFTPINVQKFISLYKEYLLQEDMKILKDFEIFQRQFGGSKRLESRHGSHWSNCPWAYNTTTCGPDTCGCSFYARERLRVEHLINLYKNAYSSSLQTCCNIC